MKNKLIKIGTICLVLVAVGAGSYFAYNKYASGKTVKATSSYIEAAARKMNMQVNIQGTGSAYAAVSKDIVANNNGTIENLNVNVGDTVKSGTSLFTVDSSQLTQNLEKAQLNLQKTQLQSQGGKADSNSEAQNLNIDDAQNQVDDAQSQVNSMTVVSPINGMVVSENNSNSDNVQSGKVIMTVVDPSSIKVKVAVDELDIAKVKAGQKADVKFDAITDKTYTGTVETIAQVGNTTNNVTTYDVVVGIENPSNIRIGMNANVNILVDTKDNALVIPAEAIVERNGSKYVRVPNGDNTAAVNNAQSTSNSQQNRQSFAKNSTGARNASGFTGNMKLVEIKTGLVNENYVEVLSGITEGQKVLISLPQSSSSNSTNNRNSFGGFGGMTGGGLGNYNGRSSEGNQSKNSQGSSSNSNSSSSSNSSSQGGGN